LQAHQRGGLLLRVGALADDPRPGDGVGAGHGHVLVQPDDHLDLLLVLAVLFPRGRGPVDRLAGAEADVLVARDEGLVRGGPADDLALVTVVYLIDAHTDSSHAARISTLLE